MRVRLDSIKKYILEKLEKLKEMYNENFVANSVGIAVIVICIVIIIMSVITGGTNNDKTYIVEREAGITKDRDRDTVNNNGVYYNILISAFADSDGDGIGDFKGISEKLDYILELGVNGIVLSPVCDANTYHGYDVMNYYKVNNDFEVCGYTLENLIEDLKREQLTVILELPINSVSDQSEWFCEAKDSFVNSKNSKYKNYFTFSNSDSLMSNPDIVLYNKDGIFYESTYGLELPDLNYECDDVTLEIANISGFWMDKGIDGIEFDVADNLCTDKDKSISVLKNMINGLREEYPHGYFVAKSIDENATDYYQTGCDSLVQTSQKEAILSGLNVKSLYSDWLATNQIAARNFNKNAVVMNVISDSYTDRIASELPEELLKSVASMLILAPGNSQIYYGEEIGMIGTCNDSESIGTLYRYSKSHTPMYWEKDDALTATYMDSNQITGCRTERRAGCSAKDMKENFYSLYNYYRKLITIKNMYSDMYTGACRSVTNNYEGLISYEITGEKLKYMVFNNISNSDIWVTINSSDVNLDNNSWVSAKGDKVEYSAGKLHMPAYSTAVMTGTRTDKIYLNVSEYKTNYVVKGLGEDIQLINNNGVYTATVNLSKGDTFYISNNLLDRGYKALVNDGAYVAFNDSDDMIKASEKGTYNLYFVENEDAIYIETVKKNITADEVNNKLIGKSSYYMYGTVSDSKVKDEYKLSYNSDSKLYEGKLIVAKAGRFKIKDNYQVYGYGYTDEYSRMVCTKVNLDDDIYVEKGTYNITFDNVARKITIE